MLKYLTEITFENVTYCKELMSIVNEIRHLEGIKGNFILSESECLSSVVLLEKEKVASRIICSNLKETIEQQQYIFVLFEICLYQHIKGFE